MSEEAKVAVVIALIFVAFVFGAAFEPFSFIMREKQDKKKYAKLYEAEKAAHESAKIWGAWMKAELKDAEERLKQEDKKYEAKIAEVRALAKKSADETWQVFFEREAIREKYEELRKKVQEHDLP